MMGGKWIAKSNLCFQLFFFFFSPFFLIYNVTDSSYFIFSPETIANMSLSQIPLPFIIVLKIFSKNKTLCLDLFSFYYLKSPLLLAEN